MEPIKQKLPGRDTGNLVSHRKRFREYDLEGKVYIVTGGAQGLGLTLAEALVEAGGTGCLTHLTPAIETWLTNDLVHCLDRQDKPDQEFEAARKRANPDYGGSLHYAQCDVRNTDSLDEITCRIAGDKARLDGLIAAAGIQQVCPATEYSVQDVYKLIDVNYTGVFMAAASVARRMREYKCPGSMVFIASMSGFVANKGLVTPVYNSSKAAVIQLGRNLAMEWGKEGIRVNSLCPGHIITPMVKENFADNPSLKETWEKENMLGRLSTPEEYRGAALFLLSDASSFMTGSSLVIDGGHTAW